MSSIVADELAKIKSFETDTEKRRSELTLNELNYISDKQLHRKVDEEGGGSGDSTFDVLFEIDPETPSARLVKGHYSDLVFDDTTPNVKVGAYFKPYGSQTPNVVFSVSAMIGGVFEDNGVGFLISAILPQNEKFYNLLFSSDDTVEIEETPDPFPPSPIALQRGAGSSALFVDICKFEHEAFICERAYLSSDGLLDTVAPVSTHFYDSAGELINSGITFDPADAGSYDNGEWVITKSCSITYTPSNDPLPTQPTE